LLRWFKTYNLNRAYRDQVRPFNFLLAYQATPFSSADDEDFVTMSVKPTPQANLEKPKPIAPYDSDTSKAASKCFDRETGEPIPCNRLKSYRESLAQYHLHPESKFLHGEPYDKGPTCRRHVEAIAIQHIGKEANRWEEQFYLGVDEDEQIEYGVSPNDLKRAFDAIRSEIRAVGQRNVARESGISRRTVSHVMRGKIVRRAVITRIIGALRARNSKAC
jgi:hypothetical protein